MFLGSSSIYRLWVLEDQQNGNFPVTKSSWHVGGNVAKILTVRAEGGLYDLFCGEETDQMSSKFRNCDDDDDDEDYQLT